MTKGELLKDLYLKEGDRVRLVGWITSYGNKLDDYRVGNEYTVEYDVKEADYIVKSVDGGWMQINFPKDREDAQALFLVIERARCEGKYQTLFEINPKVGDVVILNNKVYQNREIVISDDWEIWSGAPYKWWKKKENVWDYFKELVESITYKPGWYFRTGVEDDRMWVQVGVTDETEISFDPIEGKMIPWRGAKHYLSKHMCRQEVVGTVFHAIDEVKEWFRYKGRSIYNPHLDPDALVEVAKYKENFNTRDNAMTMDEDNG